MSKLAQLQGKAKTYTIGGIELEIKPLGLDDMYMFTIGKEASPKEQTEIPLKLMDKVLKESVPDSTPEERKSIGIEYMQPLMAAIIEVNGLKDQKGNALNAIKTRQSEIQAQRRTQ